MRKDTRSQARVLLLLTVALIQLICWAGGTIDEDVLIVGASTGSEGLKYSLMRIEPTGLFSPLDYEFPQGGNVISLSFDGTNLLVGTSSGLWAIDRDLAGTQLSSVSTWGAVGMADGRIATIVSGGDGTMHLDVLDGDGAQTWYQSMPGYHLLDVVANSAGGVFVFEVPRYSALLPPPSCSTLPRRNSFVRAFTETSQQRLVAEIELPDDCNAMALSAFLALPDGSLLIPEQFGARLIRIAANGSLERDEVIPRPRSIQALALASSNRIMTLEWHGEEFCLALLDGSYNADVIRWLSNLHYVSDIVLVPPNWIHE